MNILLCPDKFKGTLTAAQVCDAIAEGLLMQKPDLEIIKLPMADGGEGSIDAIQSAIGGELIPMFVKDPLFRNATASYLREGNKAYIEMAAASGLQLVKPGQRNPEYTTTYGTGQLIKHAWKNGCKEIYLFVGGSATNDGGMGMATAFGYNFTDNQGHELPPIGLSLAEIQAISAPEILPDFELFVVCDVNNTLYGPNGAAHVFGEQKGADEAMKIRLDEGLENLSERIKSDLGKDVSQVPGGGAAGGIAAGAMAFLNAKILPGAATIMEIVNFRAKLKDADLIITGEGKVDTQTLSGKLISGIAQATKEYKKDLWIICGKNELSVMDHKKLNVAKLYDLSEISGHEYALSHAASCMHDLGQSLNLAF